MGADWSRRHEHSAGAGVLRLLDQCLAVIVLHNLKAADRALRVKEPDLAGHGPDARVGQRHDQMPKRHRVEVSVGVIRYNDFAPGLYQTRVERGRLSLVPLVPHEPSPR